MYSKGIHYLLLGRIRVHSCRKSILFTNCLEILFAVCLSMYSFFEESLTQRKKDCQLTVKTLFWRSEVSFWKHFLLSHNILMTTMLGWILLPQQRWCLRERERMFSCLWIPGTKSLKEWGLSFSLNIMIPVTKVSKWLSNRDSEQNPSLSSFVCLFLSCLTCNFLSLFTTSSHDSWCDFKSWADILSRNSTQKSHSYFESCNVLVMNFLRDSIFCSLSWWSTKSDIHSLLMSCQLFSFCHAVTWKEWH
jgi:hypothetical protein